MRVSVIIPAWNEEAYVGNTLHALQTSAAECSIPVDVIVVDNLSSDETAGIAREAGADVVQEPVHNVALVRNAGARAAQGDILVFLDADTIVPPHFLPRIVQVMQAPAWCGGAADLIHRPSSRLARAYLLAWRMLGKVLGLAQGAAQFCRSDAFKHLGGYDETLFMGEDVDFYWRLRRYGKVEFLKDVQVVPSPRRFDSWPLWRILLWTNPLFVIFFRRFPHAWPGWYSHPPR